MTRSRLIRCAPGLLALAGCATGTDYARPDAAQLTVPRAYTQPADQATPGDLSRWWTALGDPMLVALVDQALGENLDIAVARTRLTQAREALIQSRADLLPDVGGSAGVRRNFNSRFSDGSALSIGADASWQADLFGGIRRGVEAARADAAGASYNLEATRIAIAGEVARNYVVARTAQASLAIARDTLRTQDDNLEIAGFRVQAGLVSSLDREQARAQRAQTAATIPNLEQNFAAAGNRLGVLTGQAPGALVAQLTAPEPIPQGPATIAAGIPADTLRQRPDVRSAERALASATARIGVAQAQLYPALGLSGSIGTNAASVGGLADILTGNLFAGLTQVIFDAGRRRSQVRAQEAAAEGALATYRQTVLIALEDVENGLAAVQAARRRQAELAVALDAANIAAILARSQYRAGLTDFQTLLDAERSLLSARDGLSRANGDQATALIQLYLALGGGWTPEDVN